MKTKKQLFFLVLTILVGTTTLVAQNFEWVKQFKGTTLGSVGRQVVVDASGNVYTTGVFQSTVDFDPGVGVFNLTDIEGYSDIFISKLDALGNLVWAKQIGGVHYQQGYSIAVDASYNVYITGVFYSTIDTDPNAGIFNLTSAGSADVLVMKLDASGNLTWAKQMGGTGFDEGESIAVDVSGNVYVTGSFYDIADFDPNAGVFNLTSLGYTDVFITKLDASGNLLWAKQMGGLASDGVNSIVVDTYENVYTTGFFEGTVDFDPGVGTLNFTSPGSSLGASDIFVSKLSASGSLIWAKQIGGTGTESGLCIAIDEDENVYTTGSFQASVDFDPGAGTLNVTSKGSSDIFVNKLDASGNLMWVKQMGGESHDYGLSIALDSCKNVYITGLFLLTADFDPGVGTLNLVSVGGGTYDIFISKLDVNGDLIWAKQLGGTGNEDAQSIVVDVSGNIYTTGQFQSTVDFDPGVGTFNLTPIPNGDIFVHKMVQNDFNCTDTTTNNTDTITNNILTNPEFSFYVPNAFTPDGDGINDFFGATGVGVSTFEMIVFDRWGNLVFSADEINKMWDGTFPKNDELVAQDVYVWKASITNVFQKKINYIGVVTVVR